jgi:hypothetical protein
MGLQTMAMDERFQAAERVKAAANALVKVCLVFSARRLDVVHCLELLDGRLARSLTLCVTTISQNGQKEAKLVLWC